MWISASNSSSRSLSSSSSSSYITTNCNNHNNENPLLPAKTLEEVWQDISLIASDLPHHHQCHTSSRGVILQNFFSNGPPLPNSSPPPPPPIHPTMLTLSSAPVDHFSSLLLQHQQPISNVTFDAAVPPVAAVGKKRFPEIEKCSGDLRHKRMIKNRESATRSRARKQESAYTNELELKVEELKEENAMLKKQQEQLQIAAAAAAQNQKKKSLNRASTAPF